MPNIIFRFLIVLFAIGPLVACKNSEKTHTKDQHKRKVHTVDGHREVFPQIIGGPLALQRYLNYPNVAQKNNIQGTVVLSFDVTKKGRAENIQVRRGIGYGCNQAAIRAIRSVRFKPGTHDGKPVNVRLTRPIIFRLQ